MRIRPQKLERIKFRRADARVREALEPILARLPEIEAPSGGSVPAGDAEWLFESIRRRLAEAEPLRSPLSFYALERDGDELVLVRADALPAPDREELPRRDERTLARMRRTGPERYTILG